MRALVPPFVAAGPPGVAIRTRLKGLTVGDETVLREVGAHLGSLASRDLKTRCADGVEHNSDRWAARLGVFGGANRFGKDRWRIDAYRCRKCGHLELHASEQTY
ncbi:hypothetical protein [Actinomadura algeriensis]|uniref:Transposase n=1 Tax=Actinomadura algeriensis TaxID=1679523 RepID=A0ABR9JYI8_9ACTN|nr:hypothetical protein [Actinomadura algeriensis]MBE1535641.1 hypothetical protein [Actinomadura algeriensis]